jgi:hypothetical protein
MAVVAGAGDDRGSILHGRAWRMGGDSAGAEVAEEEGVGVDVCAGNADGVFEDVAYIEPDEGVGRGRAALWAVGGAGEVAEVVAAAEAGDGVVAVIGQVGGVLADGAGGVRHGVEKVGDEVADGEVGGLAAVEEGFEVAVGDLDGEAFFEAEDDVEEVEAHGGDYSGTGV